MKHNPLRTMLLVAALCMIAYAAMAQSPRPHKKSALWQTLKMPAPSFLHTDSLLPPHIDLRQDISRLSYQDLRLLRNYPYAIHGLWFGEADINSFYCNRTDWYRDMCEQRACGGDDTLYFSYDEVRLTPAEQAFVEKIDRRMAKLRTRLPGGDGHNGLLSPVACVNLYQINQPDDDFLSMLQRHNMAIVPTDCEQLFNVYEENDYLSMPSFITTDLFLQAFHMYFGYALKSLESREFVPRLHRAVSAMRRVALADTLSEAGSEQRLCADFAATFFSIAEHLLTGQPAQCPPSGQKDYHTELASIMACADAPSEFMRFSDAYFPYSLFKPRGHYTRSEAYMRYFRAMMWLQTAVFCREDEAALRRVAYMAQLLNTIDAADRACFTDVYDALTFLMGQPDNLSIRDVADHLRQQGITGLPAALSPGVVQDVGNLLDRQALTRNRIAPKVQVSCKDKVNLMPQRYMADSEVLANMADEAPGSEKPFPRAEEVMAALGVEVAAAVLDTCYNEAAKWPAYEEIAALLRKRIGGEMDWDASLYNKWMDCLVQLQQPSDSLPAFMNTPAWQLKNLNTALASWTTLKHDAVLYAEQPFMAECGGCGPPSPTVRGYVEPNLGFWDKLGELITLTQTLLRQHGLLTADLKDKSQQLKEMVDFCIGVSQKERSGQSLTEKEYETIRLMGSSMEWFTLSVLDPDCAPDHWSLVEGPDKSVAVVADVFTRNVEGCPENGILHEATGNAQAVYVLVSVGGECFLTRGAIYSHYEFRRPPGERLTDEEWQQMLRDGNVPQGPRWLNGLILKREPEVNELIFYSSGC